METLEKKIQKIVENNGHYSELIASEIKDIATSFVDYVSDKGYFHEDYINNSELIFDKFIEERFTPSPI